MSAVGHSSGAVEFRSDPAKIAYSYREVIEATGLGRTFLSESVRKGKLKSYRVGRRRLFSVAHIKEFLASFEVQ